ncbi:MAG: TraR/DksA family transcriptional regulator, partial [Bacteroidota bacterium]|nr:TraR/DksA family transcriptional regulator [Bacteroidota bacterium]
MDKKKLKKTILDKIAQLETEIKEIKNLAAPIEPENAIGRISRMDAINNKTINDRLLRNAAEKLKKLNLALHRIHEPKFGFCTLCEQAI